MRSNKAKTPLVSVVMTAYNGGRFVGEAIESICKQTYANWELIVVNDGSTDSTKQILSKIARADKRIHVINCRTNRGASYASNLGIAKAMGIYLARMDSDDIALPDRLVKQVEFLQTNPSMVAVGGQCKLIDKDGKEIGEKNFPLTHGKIYGALFSYNPIQHPAIMINRSLLRDGDFVYHNNVLLAHDLELLFFLSQYGELANLPDTVLKYRIHSDSLSLHNPKQTFRDTAVVRKIAIKKYGYSPSMSARVMNMVQQIVITLLPSVVIYPIFHAFRMRQVGDMRQVVVSSAQYAYKRVQAQMAVTTAAIAAWVVR